MDATELKGLCIWLKHSIQDSEKDLATYKRRCWAGSIVKEGQQLGHLRAALDAASRWSGKVMPLTQEAVNKYIAGGGGCCPFCGANSIEGGHIEIEGNCAYQEVSCLACDATWTDSYHLAAVIDTAGDGTVWDDTGQR